LARVRAEVQAMRRGEGDDTPHGVVVAGVTAAGDVHALDDGAERRGEGGWFVLTEVAVEVEGGHLSEEPSDRSDLSDPTDRTDLLGGVSPSRWG
jgi:hypothetical protein